MAMENPRASGDRGHGAFERGASGLEKVSAELSVLFDSADLTSSGDADHGRSAKLRSVRRSAPPSERRFAVAGGVVAAALAGIAAGALLGRVHPLHPLHQVRPAAPAPAPDQTVAQAPASSWDDSMITYAPPRQARARRVAGAAAAEAAKPQRPKAARAASSRPSKTAQARQQTSRCAGLGRSGRVVCQRRLMRAADDRLRRAYAQAVRAHVPRALLLSYRRDWAELRRQAARRPEQTAAAYDRLARDLSRQARPTLRGRR